MEKHKKNKNPNTNMTNKKKSILSIFLLVALILISPAYSAENYVLKYEFEEGEGGSIVFDSSGNGFIGVTTSTSWTTTEAFGTYAMDFDGSNDWVETTLPLNQITRFSLGGWIRPFSTNTDTIIDIEDGTTNKLELQMGDEIVLDYVDDSGVYRTLVLSEDSFPVGDYIHIALSIDSVQEEYEYWENAVLISSGEIVGGYNSFSSVETVRIGANLDGGSDLDAYLDAIFVVDFFPSESQLTELMQQNVMTLAEDETGDTTETLEGLVRTDLIIGDYTPYQNNEHFPDENIEVNLNTPAKCEFYVDSNLYREGEDQISYTWEQGLDYGSYHGNFYCWYDYNNTRYYDMTTEFPFTIVAGDPALITFFVSGLDFNVDDESLYLTTPCIKHVLNVGEIAKDADKNINEGREIFFQKVLNGKTTFNISPSEHEFCLVNGLIQYSEEGFTSDFNINEVHGVVELGVFDVPSNVTQSYSIQTELLDIYDINDPKAFGETWGSIIGGLILLIFGALILFSGVKLNNGKIVIAGVLLCLASMGISFSGFLGVLV